MMEMMSLLPWSATASAAKERSTTEAGVIVPAYASRALPFTASTELILIEATLDASLQSVPSGNNNAWKEEREAARPLGGRKGRWQRACREGSKRQQSEEAKAGGSGTGGDAALWASSEVLA
ncbi:hypothetical protein E2562_035026 [Oryza meyeriana var. granulata]|uniref:Uncharacterized protein n=1 Tax=Oryza meyeriana var. granulata TaxID=110450 RepID=A0A6G1FFA9_9ORYZ|nr:hypothetical protein E2562_035026 [Oryza meyeriana var. granulata]